MSFRDNGVNATFSELYHVNGANGYDKLGQLTSFQRGTLNGTKDAITGTADRKQDWTFDALGNWSQLDTTVGTNPKTTESRTHDKLNEVTAVGGRAHTYNANGTLKTEVLAEIDPATGQPFVKSYFYDTFDRLVLVKKGNQVLAAYSYDALGRRVTENHGTEVLDLYYSTEWQVLEERVNGVVKSQYVWSPEYIDALILRDRDTNSNGVTTDSTDERLYALQDVNFNVTGVVGCDASPCLPTSSWSVKERYVYTPYGEATILTAGWSTISSSSVSWIYLHQGTRFDITVGLYHNRNRDYSPTLGRWISSDPLGLTAGDPNLYRANGNSPGNYVDPTGLRFEPTMDSANAIDGPGGGGAAPEGAWISPFETWERMKGEPFPWEVEVARKRALRDLGLDVQRAADREIYERLRRREDLTRDEGYWLTCYIAGGW